MNVSKVFILCATSLVLLIALLSEPIESTKLIYRLSPVNTIHIGNVISSPMVRCKEGYHLDHRRKCRPIVGSFFPNRRPK